MGWINYCRLVCLQGIIEKASKKTEETYMLTLEMQVRVQLEEELVGSISSKPNRAYDYTSLLLRLAKLETQYCFILTPA